MGKRLALGVLALVVPLALGVLACARADPSTIRKYTVTPSLTPLPTGTPTSTMTPNASDTPNALGVVITATPPPFPYFAVVVDRVAVRLGPGEEFGRYKYLEPGDVVEVIELVTAADGGTWARVGDDRFVNIKYLSKK